jgi:aryl-alcohol dehydrogenase-like predicted oxidoreductase
LIGQAVCHDRDSWLIATKFGHRFRLPESENLWQPDEVLKQLEDSLRALQADRIDLYQFHSGEDDVFDNDELWTMLARQVELGKIGHLGISISSIIDPAHQVSKAVEVGAGALQVVYNRLDRGAEETTFPGCEQGDLGVLARVPLASGFLTSKYKPGQTFESSNDPRSSLIQDRIDERLQLVQEIEKEEVPAGVEMAAWALAWCLQNPAVTCVIPGTKSVEQLEANASAVGLDMVRDDHPQAWQ